MEYGKPMPREAVKVNSDGTFTVSGGGWFFAVFDSKGNLLRIAEGMKTKPSHRLFIQAARETLRHHKFING